MSRLCLDLEEAGESQDLSTAAVILEPLGKEFDRVRTELSALVGRATGCPNWHDPRQAKSNTL
ncbi:MAG TPA: hypothetical protein VJ827_06270 [Rubrobacter sp.]|nr:hypothetical protein [Rubrobacter sp.]